MLTCDTINIYTKGDESMARLSMEVDSEFKKEVKVFAAKQGLNITKLTCLALKEYMNKQSFKISYLTNGRYCK